MDNAKVGTMLRVGRGNGKYLKTGTTVKVIAVVDEGFDSHGACNGYIVTNASGGRDKDYIWDRDRFTAPLPRVGQWVTVQDGNGRYLHDGDRLHVRCVVNKGHDKNGPVSGLIVGNARGKAKPYIWDFAGFGL